MKIERINEMKKVFCTDANGIAERSGLSVNTVKYRLKRYFMGKISAEDVEKKPYEKQRSKSLKKYGFVISEKAKELGISHSTLCNRLRAFEAGKMTIEEALMPNKIFNCTGKNDPKKIAEQRRVERILNRIPDPSEYEKNLLGNPSTICGSSTGHNVSLPGCVNNDL